MDPPPPVFRTALSLVESSLNQRRIVTFCARLDALLHGGVALGQTLELCGEPGVGKTSLAMQIALDAAIPAAFDGLDAGALMIDAECALDAARLARMADALSAHLCALRDARLSENPDANIAATPTRDEILARIHVHRPHSFLELAALLHALPHLVRTLGVRVVVVDSVAAHVRGEPLLDDAGGAQRTRFLAAVAQRLCECAHSCNVAVVVTNHLTVVPPSRNSDNGVAMAQHMPALGDRWRHWCETRVLLEFDGFNRTARILKGNCADTITVPFRICDDGVRDDDS
jgi:DNA repair protein RadA